MYKPIILAAVAGISGGHIIPAITYLHKQTKGRPARCLFFSTDGAFDKELIGRYAQDLETVSLPLSPFPGFRVWRYPAFFYRFCASCMSSLVILHRAKPERVISMGGAVSVPVCVAAWLLRIPIELCELNVDPGRAVRFVAPFAHSIRVCFEETKQFFAANNVQLMSYPLRFSLHDRISRQEACASLGIDPAHNVLVVLGGSQGSHEVTNEVMRALATCAQGMPLTVLHQVGHMPKEKARVKQWYEERGIDAHVVAYEQNLAPWYAASDLVVSRAGAGTLWELAFFERPAVLIPLEHAAQGHQYANAVAMKKRAPKQFVLYSSHERAHEPDLLCNTLKKVVCAVPKLLPPDHVQGRTVHQ